jgi:hypothetical protein
MDDGGIRSKSSAARGAAPNFLQRRVVAAMLTPPASDKRAAGGVLLASGDDYVPGWPACGWTLRPGCLAHHELVVVYSRLGQLDGLVADWKTVRKR